MTIASCSLKHVSLPAPFINVYNSANELWNDPGVELWTANEPLKYCDDSDPKVPGSYRPVSVDIFDGGEINLSYDLDELLTGVPYFMAGRIGDKVVGRSSDILYARTHGDNVTLTIQPPSANHEFPWGYVGDVEWYLEFIGSDETIPCGVSRLEMYGLGTLPAFFKNKIGVGLLRAFVPLGMLDTAEDFVSWAVKACFFAFGFTYNIIDGAAAFGTDRTGGTYHLQKWLSLVGTGAKVNCYDQAGLVQIALGLSPKCATTWIYIEQFGYLAETGLIGEGRSNNPFFGNPSCAPAPICGDNDPKRSNFANHAFVQVNSKDNCIADACAGPHLATQDLAAYLASAIEQPGAGPNRTTLYNSTGTILGTVNDAARQPGVTSLMDGTPGMLPMTNATVRSSSNRRIDSLLSRASTGQDVDNGNIINVDIRELKDRIMSANSTEVVHRSHNIAEDHSILAFVLSSGGQHTDIDIAIHKSKDDALKAFHAHLLGYHIPVDEVFAAAAGNVSHGSHCLTSEAAHLPHSSMLWVRGNIFTRVSGPFRLQQLDEQIVKPIDSHYHNRYSSNATLQQPRIEDIVAPVRVRKGEQFMVQAAVAEAGAAAVSSGDNEKVILLRADDARQEYLFRAERTGTESLVFAFAHMASGHVVTRSANVEIVDD